MTYLVHAFWTAVMVASVLWSGEHPGTLYFAYLFNYLYRVLVLCLLSLGTGESLLVRLLSRRPVVLDVHMPIQDQKRGGAAAQPWAYLLLILFLGYVGFILAHSISTTELDIDFRGVVEEFAAASWLALIWLLQDLTGKRLVMEPGKPISHNLGYNAGETALMALAVLTGAFLLAVVEGIFGGDRNPWLIVGTLLFYKWLWGVWEDDLQKKRSGMNADERG